MQPENVIIRHAGEEDVMSIYSLLVDYARQQLLLARDPDDIRYHIKNFVIAVVDGKTVGCCALRDFGSSLYEVRSLAVAGDYSGRGIATKVVKYLVDNMMKKSPCRIFALTYHPQLFIRIGFHYVSKEFFPPKIWCDCSSCPKKDNCDEEAVLMDLS